jgi:hypothetical protein
MEEQLRSMAKTNNGPRTLTQDIVVSGQICGPPRGVVRPRVAPESDHPF